MKTASAIVEGLLQTLRREFYHDRAEERWYWELPLLKKAVTLPAWDLSKRGAELPAERYEAILLGIIATIRKEGNVNAVRNFGQYLLTAVQRHMRVRWNQYYQEALALRRDDFSKAIPANQPARDSGSPVPTLAEAHRALLAAKGGRPKTKPAKQAELF
jgi:hypothetical protein